MAGDDSISALVQEVTAGSAGLRELWSSTHEVARMRSSAVLVRHHVAGDLDFTFEALELAAAHGIRLIEWRHERS